MLAKSWVDHNSVGSFWTARFYAANDLFRNSFVINDSFLYLGVSALSVEVDELFYDFPWFSNLPIDELGCLGQGSFFDKYNLMTMFYDKNKEYCTFLKKVAFQLIFKKRKKITNFTWRFKYPVRYICAKLFPFYGKLFRAYESYRLMISKDIFLI